MPGEIVQPSPSGSNPAERFQTRALSDGRLQVRVARGNRRSHGIVLLLGVLSLILAGFMVPVMRDPGEESPQGILVGALVLALAGGALIFAYLRDRFGTTDWLAGPDQLDVVRGWTFRSQRTGDRYQAGTLLVRGVDPAGQLTVYRGRQPRQYQLCVQDENGEAVVFPTDEVAAPPLEEVRYLGTLLAGRTGWPLRDQAPTAESASGAPAQPAEPAAHPPTTSGE